MATSVSGAAPNKRGRVGECILLKVVMDTSLGIIRRPSEFDCVPLPRLVSTCRQRALGCKSFLLMGRSTDDDVAVVASWSCARAYSR